MKLGAAVGLIGAIVVATGIGCSDRSVTWRVVDTSSTRTWTGERLSAVVDVWGPCAAPQPDGNGGTICLYSAHTPTRIDSASAITAGSNGIVSPPSNPLALRGGGSPDELSVDAKFWLNAEGKVYRYWFADGVWKSHPEKTKPAP